MGASLPRYGVAEYVLVEGFVRDEQGGGWGLFKNYYNDGFSASVDFKLGGICRWHMGYTLWGLIAVNYPLLIGGRDLGMGGCLAVAMPSL